MRPTKAIATCAVTTMAMVFSVQQGEHGPLVTYKLEVPRTVETAGPTTSPTSPVPLSAVTRDMDAAAPSAYTLPADVAPLQAIAPAAPKMSPLEPTTLGTVVLPVQRTAAPQQIPAASGEAQRIAVDYQRLFRSVTDQPSGEALTHAYRGDAITLEQVNHDLSWRRETAQRLRNYPFAPRF
ncbi:hypothetical protein AAFN88_17210 [Pelagibius sp. CAU 1746]|uniref:hypothetical protein n=1 Tax=Pelagibius sp. CAU 1746 TaxID=3140370 RepID=UPI00325C2AC0